MPHRALALLALLAATATAEVGMQRAQDAGLRYRVPTRWTRVPAPSDMRAAQYRIEGPADGAVDDAEVVLFFFGRGQGGSTQANLERWYSQFVQLDGRPSREAARVTTREVNGLHVTAVDLSGTYHPVAMGPGAARGPQPGMRMLAAAIEGGGGPWFLRIIGRQEGMDLVAEEFDRVLGSLEPHE